LEEIGEILEKDPKSNAVYEDGATGKSPNDNLDDDWCVGGVIDGEWVPCGKLHCKNCQI
jgi:hypothetical protein